MPTYSAERDTTRFALWAAFSLAWFAALTTRPLLAQPLGPERSEKPLIVLLSAGDQRWVDNLHELLESEGDARSLVLNAPSGEAGISPNGLLSLATSSGALALLSLRADPGLTLYIAVPARAIVYRRRFEQASEEATRLEQASLVARSALRALLEGQDLTLEQLPPPRTPAPKVSRSPAANNHSPPNVEPRTPMGAFIGASIGQYASRMPSLGLDFGVLLRLGRGSLLVSYEIQRLPTLRGQGVEVRLARRPIRLGLGYHAVMSRWSLGAEFFGVADLVSRSTLSVNSDWVRTPDTTSLGLATGLRGMLGLHVLGPLFLTLRAGVEAAWYAPRVRVGEQTLVEPWLFRPGLELGTNVGVW